MEKPPIVGPTVEEGQEDGYQFVADKVGFVPNVRKEDNVFQAKFLGFTLLITVPLCAAFFEALGSGPWWAGALLGFLGGGLAGLLVSGAILAIRNLKR